MPSSSRRAATRLGAATGLGAIALLLVGVTATGATATGATATGASALGGAATAVAATSYTPGSYAARLAELVNQARAQQNIAPLSVTRGTTHVAQDWADQVTASGRLAHNPNLPNLLAANGSPNWTYYSENLGYGRSDNPDTAFAAYMQAGPNRDHVLDPRAHFLGVGVDFAGERAYNVLDFVDSYQANPPAQTQAVATPAVAGPPSAQPSAQPSPQPSAADVNPVPSPVASATSSGPVVSAGATVGTNAVAGNVVSDSGVLVGFKGTKRFLVFCGAALILWMGLLNRIVVSRGTRRRPARVAPVAAGGTQPEEQNLASLLKPYHDDRS